MAKTYAKLLICDADTPSAEYSLHRTTTVIGKIGGTYDPYMEIECIHCGYKAVLRGGEHKAIGDVIDNSATCTYATKSWERWKEIERSYYGTGADTTDRTSATNDCIPAVEHCIPAVLDCT